MDLSVVIPVYNEAENIEPLLREINDSLHGHLEYEIIIVDDDSTDETSTILNRLLQHQPRLRVLQHQARCGQSTAILTGVKASKAEWIATLDGDGQNDPADIMKLIEVRDQQMDKLPALVTGIRHKRKDSWIKRVSSRIANGVRSRILRDNTPDTGCGLKLFSRQVFLDLPHFDHMHRFIPALFQRENQLVLQTNVNHRPRLKGVSKYGTFDRLRAGIVDLVGVSWLLRRNCKAPAKEMKNE